MNANAPPTVRTGRWTQAEMEYLEAIIQHFRDGTLDIPNGTTLRGYIADELRCLVKRISKKMEGTNYNGRQSYERKLFDEAEMEIKKKELCVMKDRFEKSVEELHLAEVARLPGNRGGAAGGVVRDPPAQSSLTNNGLAALGGGGLTGLVAETLAVGGGGALPILQDALLAAGNNNTTNQMTLVRILILQRLQAHQRLQTMLAARATNQYINALQQLTAATSPPTAATEQPHVVEESPEPGQNSRLEALLAATNARSQALADTPPSRTRLQELLDRSGDDSERSIKRRRLG